MKSVLSDRIKKAGTILLIPVDMITSNPEKVRKNCGNIDALTESVRQNGIIQPLTVRFYNDKFQIISGERRYRAALRLSLETVPCIVMSASDEKSIVLSLIENSFSLKNDFFDELYALYKLNYDYGLSVEHLSQNLCRSNFNIEASLAFFEFSDEIRKFITDYELQDYILSLSRLKTNDERLKFIEFILSKNNIIIEKTETAVKKPVVRFSKLNDYRIFINSINHTVDTMRSAGINAVITQKKRSGYIECVIRIPEMTSSPVRTVCFSCDAV